MFPGHQENSGYLATLYYSTCDVSGPARRLPGTWSPLYCSTCDVPGAPGEFRAPGPPLYYSTCDVSGPARRISGTWSPCIIVHVHVMFPGQPGKFRHMWCLWASQETSGHLVTLYYSTCDVSGPARKIPGTLSPCITVHVMFLGQPGKFRAPGLPVL